MNRCGVRSCRVFAWIVCPSSCDCRAILRRAMRAAIGSGLGWVRLLPRLLRIPCGFVFFAPVAPFRLISAVPIQSVPPACFAPIRPFRPVSFRSRSSSSAHALLASSPIASAPSLPGCRPVVSHIAIAPHRLHAPPAVSGELGVFAKRIEFDAFKIMAAERLISYCLLTAGRIPYRPVGSSHAAISPCSPNPITGTACGRGTAPITLC